jgi:hypothetical protein
VFHDKTHYKKDDKVALVISSLFFFVKPRFFITLHQNPTIVTKNICNYVLIL